MAEMLPTKIKTKEKEDVKSRPHLAEYGHRKMVQKGFERLERHPGTGYLGLPSKSGHGGKYTWQGPAGNETDLIDPPVAVDEGDPNYIDETLEEVEEEIVVGEVEAPAAPQGVARIDVVRP